MAHGIKKNPGAAGDLQHLQLVEPRYWAGGDRGPGGESQNLIKAEKTRENSESREGGWRMKDKRIGVGGVRRKIIPIQKP